MCTRINNIKNTHFRLKNIFVFYCRSCCFLSRRILKGMIIYLLDISIVLMSILQGKVATYYCELLYNQYYNVISDTTTSLL